MTEKPTIEVKPKIQKGLDDVYVKESSICLVDGIKGRLLYRGWDIRDLAEHSSFEETIYILIHGRLPKTEELAEARRAFGEARAIGPEIVKLLRCMPEDAPPIDVLRTAVSYLSNFDKERDDPTRAANMRKAQRLIGSMPTLVAAHHRIRQGKRVIAPDRSEERRVG